MATSGSLLMLTISGLSLHRAARAALRRPAALRIPAILPLSAHRRRSCGNIGHGPEETPGISERVPDLSRAVVAAWRERDSILRRGSLAVAPDRLRGGRMHAHTCNIRHGGASPVGGASGTRSARVGTGR